MTTGWVSDASPVDEELASQLHPPLFEHDPTPGIVSVSADRRGRDWDAIAGDRQGRPISTEAIAEAVLLACEALLIQQAQVGRSDPVSG